MRKKTVVFCFSIIAGGLLLTSCASMFGKSSYPLSINTNPSGADIAIVDQNGVDVYQGQSPATVTLKSSGGYLKSATYNIRLSYKGYKEQSITVTSKINGWYWANIALGGLIGMLIVDPLTGAMYKLDNAPVNITLVKDDNTIETAENKLNIIDIKNIPEDLKEYLVRLN